MRFILIISSLFLLVSCITTNAVGQQTTKEDSVENAKRKSSISKKDSLLEARVEVRFPPQTEMYVMDINKASKNHIAVKDAMKNLGKEGAAKGKVFGYLQKEGYVEVYIGGSYPNHLLELTLNGECLKLAPRIDGKTISIIGPIQVYKSKPAMIIGKLQQIVIH